MNKFESSVTISASPEALFELTQDYDRRLDWDPFLCEARLVGDATEAGVGVRAWCVSKRPKVGMETEYVSFRPPSVTAIKMTKGPWFLRTFAGSWRFDDTGDGKTEVSFSYSLTTRPKMLRPIVARVLSREMRGRLDALKQYVESGSDGRATWPQ